MCPRTKSADAIVGGSGLGGRHGIPLTECRERPPKRSPSDQLGRTWSLLCVHTPNTTHPHTSTGAHTLQGSSQVTFGPRDEALSEHARAQWIMIRALLHRPATSAHVRGYRWSMATSAYVRGYRRCEPRRIMIGATTAVLDQPYSAEASDQHSTPDRQPATGNRRCENQSIPSRCTPSAAAVGARRALPTRAHLVTAAARIPTVMMRTLGACIVGGCGASSYIPTSGLCRTLDRLGV